MTLKNNRAPLLCYFKLYASFHSHQWIKTKVAIRKRSIRVKISDFFVPCDLEIWRMTLIKKNRALLLCYFKLCASFRSHWWIQTRVTIRKRPVWVKIEDILSVWPWKLTYDLEKQWGTSPKQHQAVCIIPSSYVNSNCSYSPETAKLGHDLCDLDLYNIWPWPFAWTSLLSLVITPENVLMIRWWEHSQKGVTDRRTVRRTDWTIHS